MNLILDQHLVKTKTISDKIGPSDGLRFLIVQPDLGYKVVDKKSYIAILEELIPSEKLAM